MSATYIKILFIADTHLGFDLPLRPRVERRRRGTDFFNNYKIALRPALEGAVDCVVHGGDVFFRSRVHPKIVEETFAPLLEIAECGIPVFIVPGNHERSQLLVTLLESHPLLHIFDQPRTFTLRKKNLTLAFSGFPHVRGNIRDLFKENLARTDWSNYRADFRFLCMHQIVEGSQVGVQNYTFRKGADIIPGEYIPHHFDAVLSGHIHRAQTLKTDLAGGNQRPLLARHRPCPHEYRPGSAATASRP